MIVSLSIAIIVLLGLVGYLWFLKRQIRQLTKAITKLPKDAKYGSRFYLDFREANLINLTTALNQLVDTFEVDRQRQRRAEKQLQLSITGLSHDLRTPLTAINGYVQLLQQTDDPAKRAQYLATIQKAVGKLVTMADEFYDLTRLDGAQKQADLKTIILNEQVETEFLGYFDQFEARHLQVTFSPVTRGVLVVADEQLLARVLQNVIQNGLRYAQSQVKVDYTQTETQEVLRVSNDVAQNSQLAVQRVFDQFYRAGSSRTNPESSGLGLYLAKQLVMAMSGTLTATLAHDWFTLTLALPKGHLADVK